jgi:hypothetical protein
VRPADVPAGGDELPSRTDKSSNPGSLATVLWPLAGGIPDGTESQVPPVDTPHSPPAAPTAPPPASGEASPAPGSSYLGQSSGTSGGSSLLLLGVSALFALLLRDGKLSCPSRDLPKPSSVPRPILERPG